MMKPQLCVQETQTTIRVDWNDAPDITGTSWSSTRWYHPDCTILYSRLPTVRKSNYEAVANAIMQALQGANMRAGQLRYMKQTPCRKPGKIDPSQMPLI